MTEVETAPRTPSHTAVTASVATVSQPTFLVGSVRSGTTLLRLMLDHHPDIAFMSEFEFVVYPVSDDPAAPLPTVDAFRERVKTDFIYTQKPFAIREGLAYEQMVNDFLVQKRGGKRFVGATVHEHFDRLLRIWPDAKFVHLLRDPRDVARSVIEMGWAGNLWTGSQRWMDAERLWDRMKTLVPAQRRLEVTHEDLIRQPEATLTRIAEFIGAPYHPDMLSYPKHSTYGPPTPSLIEQWKKKLKPDELRLVEARVGDMLAERGYIPSGQPPLTITDAMVAKLKRQDKLYRMRFRQKRYGLPLWAADVVTRRLPIPALADAVQRRLNAVDLKHIK